MTTSDGTRPRRAGGCIPAVPSAASCWRAQAPEREGKAKGCRLPGIDVPRGLPGPGDGETSPGDLGQTFLTGIQAQLAPCQHMPGVTVANAEADLVRCAPWGMLQDVEKGLRRRCHGKVAWSPGHRHPSREGAGWHELCWSHGELLEPQLPPEILD